MSITDFLLPHFLDEPEVVEIIDSHGTDRANDIRYRIMSGERSSSIFDSATYSGLGKFFEQEMSVAGSAVLTWRLPESGGMEIYSLRDRYFSVLDDEFHGPTDSLSGIQVPMDVGLFSFHANGEFRELQSMVLELLRKRTAGVVNINTDIFLLRDDRLIAIPSEIDCPQCDGDVSCQHLLARSDVNGGQFIDGYIADKQWALGRILAVAFEKGCSDVDFRGADDRNRKVLQRLCELFTKKNAGGFWNLLRSDLFYQLIENLLEMSCQKIVHAERDGEQDSSVNIVQYFSDDVVSDFETIKSKLIKEVGLQSVNDLPDDFGTIA